MHLEGPHLQRGHHRHAPARRRHGLERCAGSRSRAAREDHRHHRLRLGGERRRGAQGGRLDYLTKPVDLKQFRAVVASALGRGGPAAPTMDPSTLPSENGTPPTPRPARPAPAPAAPVSAALRRMAGHSAAMQQVRALVEKVARSMAPVLVNGESGTGKELVARAIHEISVRAAQPFIAVNCGAIPEQLLEPSSSATRKARSPAPTRIARAFPGRQRRHAVLDEIGDLPLSMQSKLLRAIQERSVRPVGAVSEQAVNARCSARRTSDLAAEVQAGRFRQDLFYRLNVIQIRVPPCASGSTICRHHRARARAHRQRCRRVAGAAPDARGAATARLLRPSPATCASWKTCCTARGAVRQ